MRSPSSSTTRASSAGASPTSRLDTGRGLGDRRPSDAHALPRRAGSRGSRRAARAPGRGRGRGASRGSGNGWPASTDARSLKHAHDLERVERIAARAVVHLGEQRSRERHPEVLVDDAVQARRLERADVDARVALGRERAQQLVDAASSRGPSGARAAGRRARRGTVAPRTRALRPTTRSSHCDVVDGDEDGLVAGSATRSAFRSATPTACASGGGPSSSSRTSARDSARRCPAGSGCERLVEHRIEEIAEPREADSVVSLSTGCACSTRSPRASAPRDARAPERRLPHSRLALEHERGRAVRDRGRRSRARDAELGVPPYDGSGHDRPIVRLRDTAVHGVHDLPRVRARLGAARRRQRTGGRPVSPTR